MNRNFPCYREAEFELSKPSLGGYQDFLYEHKSYSAISILPGCSRKTVSFFWTALTVTAALLTGTARAQSTQTQFVPFSDFIQSVQNADVKQVTALASAKVADTATVSQMKQHILSLYQGVTPVRSYVLSGQTFDCVPVDQQPAVRALKVTSIAAAPPSSAAASPNVQSGGSQTATQVSQLPVDKTTDEFGNTLGCDAGSIPMSRVTLEQMSRFSSVKNFLQKGPNGAGQVPDPAKIVAPQTDAHKYSYAYQYVYNLGPSTNLNLWRPYVYTDLGEVFSLAQSWTVANAWGPLQTAEVGWQNYPAFYGSENPALFIYWTADGYNNTGCYNLTCGAFVQVNNAFHLGVGFNNYSIFDGPQYEIQLQYYLYQGNWWLNVGGTWVGYYPGSIYGSGQLRYYSNLIEFGSESVGSTVWPSEGSTLWANNGWTYSAYHRLLYYLDLSANAYWDSPTGVAPSPACYSVTNPTYDSNWGTYFYFGGPGGASCQ